MFINTYEERDVYSAGSGWERKVCLTGNKINSNTIVEVQSLDKDKVNQYEYNNYVKVITNQKSGKFSLGFIGALIILFIPMWHSYSYKEYIVAKQDLDKVINRGD